MARIRVIQIYPYNLVTKQVELLGFASGGGYMADATHNPPSYFYRDYVKTSLNFECTLFDARQMWGASKIGQGVVEFSGVDGVLDGIAAQYAFDGCRVIILDGEETDPLSAFTTVFTGTGENWEPGVEKHVLRLRDRLADLDLPLQTNLYGGTNNGATGVDGLPGDLQDKLKPRVVGYALNVPGLMVNSTSLIGQFNDGPIQGISNPCHMGAPWALDADCPDLASLEAVALAGAHVATCNALGLYKTGTRPTGAFTADVRGDKTGGVYVETTAPVLQRLLTAWNGIDASSIDQSSFNALAALSTAQIGIYFGSDVKRLAACDQACAGAMAWYTPTVLGQFTCGQLHVPVGPGVATIDAILRNPRIQVQPAKHVQNGLPVWRVTIKYARNNCVLNKTQIAGSVAADRVEWLTQEWRTTTAEDATVKTAYPHAQEVTFETPLVNKADADALAAAYLAILKVRRDFRVFAVNPQDLPAAVDLGVEVTLQYPRLGLDAGLPFIVSGLVRDYGLKQIGLTVWG